MEDLMATFADAQEANGLEALEKVITEISETGRSVFILNKKNPDGSTRYDIRQARQSRYWVLSDAEFYKFIRFNMKEENGKYKDDTYANAIIGIRVQGGVEVGPTDGALHAHVLVTIDHISNLQVLWANYDWVVLLKEKEPSTTTENYASKLQEYLSKTLPDKQRRDLLKEWSHARNTNNTDNNTDGYLFTIFQADAGQADDPRFAPQAAEIGDLRARAEGAAKARGAEGKG
eukprot:tig00000270_g23903.t1